MHIDQVELNIVIAFLIANFKKELTALNAVVAMQMCVLSQKSKTGFNHGGDVTLAETFERTVSIIIAKTGAEFWEVNEALAQTEA